MSFNSIPLTAVTGTICKCMGLRKPEYAEDGIDMVSDIFRSKFRKGKAEKLLIYNPDAIAMWLYQKYTMLYGPVLEHTQLMLPMLASFPPVTPVCFGSMYTGAKPEVHKIEHYEKKHIKVESLFDVLAEAGLNTVLVSREGSSMSKLFEGRNITYFTKETQDETAVARGIELLESRKYDAVIVYNMDYDDSIHETEPESERSISALKRHIRDFSRLAKAAANSWKDYDTLLLFAPDHGIHKTILGVGDHYADIPEDMNMLHFYGVKPAGV